ncbi:LytTR family DNA-binding domain-containing protein [Devosia sediminis]|uniref:LytTR family transcriptional regulator n=1 Tax=Devosia sediminis TaxID=2798801 RepID=A0A934IX05_9HYPH|nr:LytTR family DNA-binding domain-containing protein [Devosia sediminis]MBJ3785917.1 LytTR family transcriptional regulator [Devosia sediminis]
MSDKPMQSTLREMQVLLRDGRSWAVLLVLSLIAGMIGPFGTYEAIPLVPRLAYWGAIVVGTAATGTLVASFLERQLRPHLPAALAAAIAGAAAGPPIAAVVAALNIGAFGPNVTVIDLVTLTTYCTLISMAVTVLSAVLGARPPGAEAAPVSAQAASQPEPALLDRLPRAQRGRLIHLAVSDHYVDVTTERGTSLVLIRLSDAIRETAPVAGLQVHRSHWVALDAVRRSLRQNGKAMLELETGTKVPVSRTYLEAARAAGLFEG